MGAETWTIQICANCRAVRNQGCRGPMRECEGADWLSIVVAPVSVADELAKDIRAIRQQIELAESAFEGPDDKGRITFYADDAQALGWGRVLCDNALTEYEARS